MHRRDFLVRTGLVLGTAFSAGGQVIPSGRPATAAVPEPDVPTRPPDWEAVRAQFNLAPDLVHMSAFFLASHPKPVREAIEAHRRALDADPVGYWWENDARLQREVLGAAAESLGTRLDEIALTDSTTMGLGLLYGGLRLREGQDILTTTHDHYSTDVSLRLRAERTGATVRSISLYDDPEQAGREAMVERLVGGLKPRTRVVAVTWVHSGTGVMLPVREIADALSAANRSRAEEDRALLCVDGVHGLGADAATVGSLGCDFFVAGTHKWMFGPRGTGLVWGAADAWPAATATIPTFDHDAYGRWMGDAAAPPPPRAAFHTPGGFHSFEHRWAAAEAFRFHGSIGRGRVAARIREQNRQLKEGLAGIPGVRLRTPMGDAVSCGITCFEVEGMDPEAVVQRLRARRIVASVTPYATRYARLAPSLLTTPAEVEETLRVIRGLVVGP